MVSRIRSVQIMAATVPSLSMVSMNTTFLFVTNLRCERNLDFSWCLIFSPAAWAKFYGSEYDVLLIDWSPLALGNSYSLAFLDYSYLMKLSFNKYFLASIIFFSSKYLKGRPGLPVRLWVSGLLPLFFVPSKASTGRGLYSGLTCKREDAAEVPIRRKSAGEWHFPNSNYDEAAHNAVDVGR